MSRIEESIEVEVPVQTAYNQWTQFEEFPRFMENVKAVRQLDDAHLHWVAEIRGREQEWDAEIVEQRPKERIAWRSTSGAPHGGVVTFHRLDDATSRVMRVGGVRSGNSVTNNFSGASRIERGSLTTRTPGVRCSRMWQAVT